MTLPCNITRMNQRDAIRIAESMGCSVRVVPRTGDAEISHPLMEKPIRFNVRKKSSPRSVGVWLRRLEEKQCSSTPN